jgi:ribonuclease T2
MKLLTFVGLLFSLLLAAPPAKSQQAGVFDYYLLNLSWSPEFCHSHASSPECGKQLGLIVHGLWPQYNGTPGGPENCGNMPGLADPSSMLDIMPDPHLIAHEWSTHGTCSGLSAADYFALIRRVYNSIHIPSQVQKPSKQFIIQASALKQAFEQSNPGLTDGEMALSCTGPYLSAVEFCFSKDGKLQPCGAIKKCAAPSLRVPAVK